MSEASESSPPKFVLTLCKALVVFIKCYSVLRSTAAQQQDETEGKAGCPVLKATAGSCVFMLCSAFSLLLQLS